MSMLRFDMSQNGNPEQKDTAIRRPEPQVDSLNKNGKPVPKKK